MKNLLFILPAVVMALTGCSTTGRQVVYDNTVQVAKRPLSGTYELGWRVKTFWTMKVTTLRRTRISLPLLSRRGIPPVTTSAAAMDPEIMAGWLRDECGPPVEGSVTLLLNGSTFFPRFENAIDCATNRILLKTYLFDNDDVAKDIADRLKARSRDIPVRVLYDSGGSRLSWGTDAPSLPPGYAYEVSDMIRYLENGSGIQMRRALHTMLTSEHSKYILIDNTAYFGGMNIGREYRYDWRDAMFELHGPVLETLEHRFETAWVLASGDASTLFKLPKDGREDAGGNLYPVQTTPFRADLYKGQLRAIRHAKQCIYIENPYLWNTSIVYELCAARKRGVDVRVTIPRDVNHGIGIAANKLTVKRLLDNGVRVFVYPGMTHVKAALYDQWACFGSANFDDLSLHKNYELNLFTQDPAIVRQIKEDLLEGGQQLSAEIFQSEGLSWLDHFTARFAQYL
jgi:cardiolipin synthase